MGLNSASVHSPEPGDDGEPGRSGLELEPEEPPGWRELVPPDTLLSLPKSQVKRQEVISGECYSGVCTAARDAPVLAEAETEHVRAAAFQQKQLGAWAVGQTQCK